jgi:transcriptional regulator with XRE-family HTH domain
MPTIDDHRQTRTLEFNLKLGENLRYWRTNAGVTQSWLAELADMSSSQLARVEAGERSITLKQAIVICQLLEIAVEDLTDTDIEEE